MKRRLLAVAVAVCGLAAGLAAQDAGARGGRGTGGITPDKSGKVTVDGCVQNPPAGTTSTSKYILTGVRATPRPGAARGASDPETTGGAASESSAAATGTDAAAATGAAAAGGTGGGAAAGRGRGAAGGPAPQIRYQLDGDEKVITPHLNHVVEIVGVLSGEPPPAPARGAAPGGAPAPITQTLKIESLKMVAALCQ